MNKGEREKEGRGKEKEGGREGRKRGKGREGKRGVLGLVLQ